MANKKQKEKLGSMLEYYHYVDESGLDDLYKQIGDFVVERLEVLEKEGAVDIDTQVGVGDLFSKIGVAKGEIKGSVDGRLAKKRSLKILLSVEQRIPVVLAFLRDQGQLTEITLADQTEDLCDGYTVIKGRFVPPDLHRVLEMKRDPTGFVVFRSNIESPPATIQMGTSLGKYRTGLHHLLVAWPSVGGRVPLKVFGYLSKKEGRAWYLKPFFVAAWKQMT